MAAVVVSIAGRTYRMSCDDGEEQRIEELAQFVES
ncbi:MAG TPA: cell division protein ZapA, partial [Methylocystis sp.]